MEVRLTSRWAGRFSGDIVSVSDARAKALQEAGIGRIIGGDAEEKKDKPVKPSKEK